MKEAAELIHTYTPYEADRAEKLDHVLQADRKVAKLMADDPNPRLALIHPTGPNTGEVLMTINAARFRFGMYLCAKSLIQDLAVKEEGKELAEDIVKANSPS